MTETGAPRAAKLRVAARSVAISVGVIALLAGCGRAEPVVHGEDRDHPLQVLVGAGGNNLAIPDGVRVGDPWTASFGQFTPCVMTGDGPLTITDVTWTPDAGLEPTSVETYVATFDGATFAPSSSIIGTPDRPDYPDWSEFAKNLDYLEIREDIVGYRATIPCTRFDQRTDPVDEFFIALTTDGGGVMVRDLQFHYETPEGKEYILQAVWDMGMCGPEMPEEECLPWTLEPKS